MFDSLPQARDYYLNSTGDKERCDKWSFHFLSPRCQGSTSEMSTRAKQTSDKSLQNWKTREDKKQSWNWFAISLELRFQCQCAIRAHNSDLSYIHQPSFSTKTNLVLCCLVNTHSCLCMDSWESHKSELCHGSPGQSPCVCPQPPCRPSRPS